MVRGMADFLFSFMVAARGETRVLDLREMTLNSKVLTISERSLLFKREGKVAAGWSFPMVFVESGAEVRRDVGSLEVMDLSQW